MLQAVNFTTETKKRYKALVVDDDRPTLLLLTTQLEAMGYDSVTAKSAPEAHEILKKNNHNIDIILLDREMPGMTGIEFVKLIKADNNLARIPVIMQTASDKPEQIREGIDVGVFYYLTKPLNKELLQSVLSAAVHDVQQETTLLEQLEKHRASFALTEDCTFTFSKLEEAEHLASFLANFYPDPERVLMGLAELLINAVEHGTLGICYDEKTKLVASGKWREEVKRRESLAENRTKKIKVIYARRKEGLYLRVTDCGPGFDWRSYMQIEPSRASDNHGRGIALANMVSFDKLNYNESGNEVTAFASFKKELEW